jgi:thiol:disulfide interchange protein
MEMFILPVIKVFKCLHQQVDEFLHQCVNMAWGAMGIVGPSLLVLCTFYKHRVSMTLQHAQTIYILKRVIVVSDDLSMLGVFLGGSPLSLFDMLLTIERGMKGGSRT